MISPYHVLVLGPLEKKDEQVVSIYQRGKSWYYDFQSRGERYAGCIGVVSKTVAKEVLAKKKAEATEGRYTSPARKPSPLLEDFVQEYLEYYRATRRPHSVRRHEIAWRAIQPVFGSKRLADIAPFDLERYRRQRQRAGKNDVTINRELAFLRHLYTMAMTWGKATANPVKHVRFAREDNGRIRMLSPEEEARLLTQCSAHLKPLVLAALHTGFRASELQSLTWDDVNFPRQMITVRAAYAKNGESRSVPMNNILTEALRAIRIIGHSEGVVFRSRKGTPYRSFRTAFERAVKQAQLRNFTFHDLRHTFASRLVMAGVDLPTVKELMGHKHIHMTLRYTHLSSDHKQRAVATLEQFCVANPINFHNSSDVPGGHLSASG
jgi:integrase